VAAEMALARVRRTRVDQLAEEGNRAAKLVQICLDEPDRYISACQLGITIATLSLGAVGENALALTVEQLAGAFGHHFDVSAAAAGPVQALSYFFAFALTALIQTIFGELLPKTLTFPRAEPVMLNVVYIMEGWCWLTAPFLKVLNGSTSMILKMLNVQEPPPRHFVHSEEELKMLVSASHEEGVLEPEEEEMLHSVFDFSDTVTGEIMTPRTDMITAQANSTVKDLTDLALKHGLSRIPIYEENIDNIFALVHIRDCLKAIVERKELSHVRELARKILIVPENKNLGDLLPEFQKSKTHMAIVVDEYGATRGMVTLEDVVEELVGEIADEYDVVPLMIQEQDDGSILIDAKLSLEDANEKLGLEIEDEEFNTLGGHVFGLLGREPAPGEEVEENGYRLRIEESDRHRIVKLRLIKLEPAKDGANHGNNVTSGKESVSKTAEHSHKAMS